MQLFQSKNINDYKPLFEGCIKDFEPMHYLTILCWCGIIELPGYEKNKYWQVWLIKSKGKAIGICGLYSQYEDTVEELWLGILHILPKHRNKGIGSQVLTWLQGIATNVGCKEIWSYVDGEGKPLAFYHNNGYHRFGTVGEYLRAYPDSMQEFENSMDHIIRKKLL